jgi:hypothetical protein
MLPQSTFKSEWETWAEDWTQEQFNCNISEFETWISCVMRHTSCFWRGFQSNIISTVYLSMISKEAAVSSGHTHIYLWDWKREDSIWKSILSCSSFWLPRLL